MRIRFLLVSVDTLGGTESAAITQANSLARDHDVEIVSILRTSTRPRADVNPKVRVRYLTSSASKVPADAVDHPVADAERLAKMPSTLVPTHWDPTLSALCDLALAHYLPAADADVVVSMTPGLLSAAAQRLPPRVALVHQEHRSSMHRTAGIEPLLAFGPRADALVSLTEVNATWLREQLGHQAPPIHVVPNAAPGPEHPRSSLDRPLIMAAGRLDAGKQYSHLVRAFGEIADEIPEWRLRIFGTGAQRAALLMLARRYGLFDRVELPGETTDLASEWAKASISAMTSVREGLPLVVQESMAAGVPVVSYDCGTGPAELIDHGANGFLVAQNDQEALADHLLRLALDSDLRQRMGAAARDAMGAYDIATITKRWEAIYQECVAARRRNPEPWLTRPLQVPSSDAAEPPTSVVPAATPGEVRRGLVQSLTEAFSGLEGWFVLPARHDTPPTFVVPAADRDAALAAIVAAGLPDHISMAVGEQDHWWPRRGSVTEIAQGLTGAWVKGVAVEPWPEIDGAATPLAVGAGVRVEFWSRDRAGDLVASRPNSFATRVGTGDVAADHEVEGVPVPGLVGMAGPFVDEVSFPIDVVYTWVDDSDPEWQAAHERAVAVSGDTQQRREASGAARFRNRDELRYSLRSLHAHAPWVRRIHVVTAGQRPEWLLDHPDVVVVDHRDILPEDALPTFNSHAIETALHRIPGLADHYVYLNDDMLLARPLRPETFFTPAGDFAAFVSWESVGLDGRDDRPFMLAAMNNRALIRERFGVTITHTLTHAPYPMRKDVLEALCAEFAEDIERTARSRFRSPTDVSPTSSLVQHYGLATGAAYRGDLDLAFVDTSRPNVRPRLRSLLEARDVDTICIGDHHDYAVPQQRVNDVLAEFFEDYFPVRPPWEAAD